MQDVCSVSDDRIVLLLIVTDQRSETYHLKNTQAMLIKLKVINHAKSVGSRKPIFCQARCITKAKPCKAPP